MITTFEQALSYLFSHIPKNEIRKFPGQLGLERMNVLMEKLGSPQEKYRVIHIAGTSGKGSTATLTSHALASQGFCVGLQLSPHLLDIRERVQINNSFISKEKFIKYLNEIVPSVEEVSKGDFGEVTYFEILVALAYYSFWKESVDYAVIETGMGGLYDGSNVVKRQDKISVITKIGFDHMAVLGNTLPEIATQKAGIIKQGNTLITTQQEEVVQAVLSKQSEEKKAFLTVLQRSEYEVTAISENGTEYIDKKRNKKRQLSLIGKHQAENAQLASEIIYQLSKQDRWEVDEQKLAQTLKSITLPGRIDIVHLGTNTLVIDGAHNTQKMNAFLEALAHMYPDQKHIFLVAFKHGKDIQSMIEKIEVLAKEIIVTDFWVDTQDMLNISEPVEIVASYVTKVPVTTIPGTKEALEQVIKKDTKIIVTGSLYFASEIYKIISKK
ncbi:MAG TPA: Mur ligase family protein [Candidatus Levybacteria bacterium]|nr:Mur ligase family protein [Candidatus Levybacteria bacterium]